MSYISRSIPYITILLKSQSYNRKNLLKNFPDFVIDDILEIIYNIIIGNVKLSPNVMNKLFKYRYQLKRLINILKKGERKKLFYSQSGGFLPILLPIISSVAGALVSKAISG